MSKNFYNGSVFGKTVEVSFVDGTRVLYPSAQMPINPETGNIIPYQGGGAIGSAKHQTKQCLENLKKGLETLDYSIKHVVRARVMIDIDYYKDIFSDVSKICNLYLPNCALSFFAGKNPTDIPGPEVLVQIEVDVVRR